MLVDLLSTDCYVSYNCQLAHVIGLDSAIYVTELINISRKAQEKNKLLEGKFFVVDRSYITNRTTFTKEKQYQIEKGLKEINVIKTGTTNDSVFIDLNVLSGLLLNGEDIQENVKKVVASTMKTEKLTQKQQIARQVKAAVYTANSELYSAYSDWIDAVCDKIGWMSKKAVTIAQQTVDNYARGNLDLALKLIEIATVAGYRDMIWAIQAFEKDYKTSFEASQKAADKPKLRARVDNTGGKVFL